MLKPGRSKPNSTWKIVGTLTLALVSVTMLFDFRLLKSFSTKTKDVQIKDAAATEFADAKGNDASGQCLDLDLNQDMDSLIASARQIFVTMPAKAGGTSMKEFTARCSKNKVKDNLLFRDWLWKEFLVDSLHVQPIISSHLDNDANLIDLTKYPTQEMLMIHIHRKESSRVISGVKQISQNMCNFWGRMQTNNKLTKNSMSERTVHIASLMKGP